MSTVTTLVKSILSAAPSEELAAPLLNGLHMYVDPSTGQAYGKEGIDAIVVEEREKARAARETLAAKAERSRRNVALEALQVEVDCLDLDMPEDILTVAGKVVAAGGQLTMDETGAFGIVGITVRTGTAGNNGGGRIGDGKRSGWLDTEGQSILGPVTSWVKKNFTEEEQKEAGAFAPQSGKFRSGEKLAKAFNLTPDPLGRE